MSETHDHGSAAPAVKHFSDTDWQILRTEDLNGAKAVVGLMTGIFILGLVLYLFVAWWTA